MTPETLQDTIDSLDDLLDQERVELLQGDLTKLARLHEKKEQLIDALGHREAEDKDRLSALNVKVERNQALFDTALDGIRSVERRLAAIRRVRHSLETYDSSGRKTSVEIVANTSVEKRA